MPYSYKDFKSEIQKHFYTSISLNFNILDVGPGAGTYGKMLKPMGFKMDCIEIWEPYVHKFNLQKIYDHVIIGNIIEFDFSGYDYIILGDVLEHIALDQAQQLIKKIHDANIKCLIAVPFEFEQDAYEDNIHETHLQPDLTLEKVLLYYPQLTPLLTNDRYGYFINYKISNLDLLESLLKKGFILKNKFHRRITKILKG